MSDWIIQHCSIQGCDSAIRVPADQSLANPICKWCDQKVSHATKEPSWPDGMPNPSLPWPWMTDQDRERKLRMPYWKERFQAHKEIYKACAQGNIQGMDQDMNPLCKWCAGQEGTAS